MKRLSKKIIFLSGLILLGGILVFSYARRNLIRFAIKHRHLCVLWTPKLESNTHALTLAAAYIPQKPIVIEAGAFDGTDSVKMAQFWPDCHVYCFEPIPELYDKVIQNTKANSRIFPQQLALADKSGTADFYVSSMINTPETPSASSSLLAPAQHLVKAPQVVFNKKIHVNTTTIDQWAQEHNIDHVDFMWLDTQGSELSILKSSPKILKTCKAILTEIEFIEAYKNQALFGEIKTWLESEGFTLIALNISSSEWAGDALFVRK